MKTLARWTVRLLGGCAGLFLLLYFGDMCLYQLRGRPQGSVGVQHFLVVPLKGNKQEFDSEGITQEACSIALFPQGALPACWVLRRTPIIYDKV